MASATANVNFSLADNPSNFTSLSVAQQAETSTGTDPSGLHFLGSNATSNASLNEMLFTTGAGRSGFVQINVSGSSSGYFRGNEGGLDLSIQSIAVSCFGGGGGIESTCVLWPDGAHNPPAYSLPISGQYYPFTLGQAFNFSYTGFAGGYSGQESGGSGYANLQFQFRFYEADGVTPVAVGAVPEPATFALFGVALTALVMGKKKLQR